MTTNCEVVIPTLIEDREEILTLESIPESVPVHIQTKGSLNEARNRGVASVEAPIVVVVDDDIAFSENTFNGTLDLVDSNSLVGLADADFGMIKGRFMAFRTKLWADIGGYNEDLHSHAGDTDFCIRALQAGYRITRFPDNYVYHQEHARSISTWDRLWRLGYLAVHYPRFAPLLFAGVLKNNVAQWTLSNRVSVGNPVTVYNVDETNDGAAPNTDERASK
jgi:glycosyltransferase involved in cell wall biosynthesis